MNDDAGVPSSIPDRIEAAAEWQAFPDDAAQLAMIAGTLWGLLSGISAAAFVGWPLLTRLANLPLLPSLLAMLVLVLLLTITGIWLGYRRWKFSQWKLDDTGMHVKRGRLWRKEILIPRSRVQHLDIERGPIERHFGLATLIVHTAGTRMHAVLQAGFRDADAVALRDALVPASGRHDDVL
jgi:uncharacterized protein